MQLAFVLCAVLWGAAATVSGGISAGAHAGRDEGNSSPGDRAWWANLASAPPGSADRTRLRLNFGPTPRFELPPPATTAAGTRRVDPTTLVNSIADDTPTEGEALWARRSGLVVVGRRPSRPAWVWRPTWSPPVTAAMRPYPFIVPASAAAELWQRMGLDRSPPPSGPRTDDAKGWSAPVATTNWLLAGAAGFISVAAAWRAVRKRTGA